MVHRPKFEGKQSTVKGDLCLEGDLCLSVDLSAKGDLSMASDLSPRVQSDLSGHLSVTVSRIPSPIADRSVSLGRGIGDHRLERDHRGIAEHRL